MKGIRAGRKGVTLTEVLISATIFSIVGVFLGAITLAVGREARETLSTVPAEQQAYRALDFVRRELLPAQAGTVNVAQDGSAITFTNPSRGTTSNMAFNAQRRVLVFTPDVTTTDGQRDWGRGITGAFTRMDALGTRFRVEVETQARNRANDGITISYTDDVTIRN